MDTDLVDYISDNDEIVTNVGKNQNQKLNLYL